MSAFLLNRTKVREYAMARIVANSRPFTAVSKKFHEGIERRLKTIINDAVHRHPARCKRLTDVPEGFI